MDELVARTGNDPGAPFVPAVLKALISLAKDDPAEFERLRAELKNAGCRIMALDEKIAEEIGDEKGRGRKRVTPYNPGQKTRTYKKLTRQAKMG